MNKTACSACYYELIMYLRYYLNQKYLSMNFPSLVVNLLYPLLHLNVKMYLKSFTAAQLSCVLV